MYVILCKLWHDVIVAECLGLRIDEADLLKLSTLHRNERFV